MVTALIVTNLIFNVFFAMTCGFICYSVLKKKKTKQPTPPSYRRK